MGRRICKPRNIKNNRLRVMPEKDVDGIANSIVPDQTDLYFMAGINLSLSLKPLIEYYVCNLVAAWFGLIRLCVSIVFALLICFGTSASTSVKQCLLKSGLNCSVVDVGKDLISFCHLEEKQHVKLFELKM